MEKVKLCNAFLKIIRICGVGSSYALEIAGDLIPCCWIKIEWIIAKLFSGNDPIDLRLFITVEQMLRAFTRNPQ